MSAVSLDLHPGQSVTHLELGEGVITSLAADGYVTVFFGPPTGQQRVLASSLRIPISPEMELLASIEPATATSLQHLWLMIEAAQIPLLETATSLTAAKIDLLPHQVVLTHRIAQTSPRRFLIADEVGLGKTVETALVLRELASRGQLQRSLMVVPAGLVENWRRELNDTFHLDFEVFGSEGDVTDRKSNAFAKHDRMIASIDTLKRPQRVARLLESPRYDLIVFDEAHHLTATRSGKKVTKTENFKLAEALRDHSRDLLLLSATPHQGDHFRFWMLIRLLAPEIFLNEQDMLQNRHRLNTVAIRRTKADACARDGSQLFARRQVHSHIFTLTETEKRFYESLCAYIVDGYNLAESQGNAGRPLGFVMTIFQKLAASSFAAVRRTLERRLLMLTVHESLVCEQQMDIDGRDRALNEARLMLQEMHGLSVSLIDQAKIDKLISEARLQLLKRFKQKEETESSDDEHNAAGEEESVTMLVSLALPEERRRIRELLMQYPGAEETKAAKLIEALGDIWRTNPREKIVVFTTYLGSVEVFRMAINRAFPEAGVEVLKGGDHGAKTAAEKRFRNPNGPRVLICTAAGREGINLQFARVLFNADLPWNPMDLEQRIGRIHRYGQKDTAQVYNLIASDTIEGEIFLLLDAKVTEIAQALGKIDEHGHVAEDLRAQILGQLSERISYDRLYQEGLRDPTLQRTRLELEVAMQNARDARTMVLELFQDLDGFRLEEYQEVDDQGQSIQRLIQFVELAVQEQGGVLHEVGEDQYQLTLPRQPKVALTSNRDLAVKSEDVDLIGLEQPQIAHLLTLYRSIQLSGRALSAQAPDGVPTGVLTIWHISIQGKGGARQERMQWLGVTDDGERSRPIEYLVNQLVELESATSRMTMPQRQVMVEQVLPSMLQRTIRHNGFLGDESSYGATLLGWIEVVA